MESYCVFEGESHFEALSVKELLENHNIYCIMPNEHLTGAVPYYSSFTGGFKILVSQIEYEHALGILAEYGLSKNNTQKIDEDIDLGKKSEECLICPQCNNASLELLEKNNRNLIVLLFLLFGIPVPAKYNVYECNTCGYSEKYKKKI